MPTLNINLAKFLQVWGDWNVPGNGITVVKHDSLITPQRNQWEIQK